MPSTAESTRVKKKRRCSDRLMVWRGKLEKTSGGLRKQDLMLNPQGRIVSIRASKLAKARLAANAELKKKFEKNKIPAKEEEKKTKKPTKPRAKKAAKK